MKLKLVTITGADDSIDPQDLVELKREYPYVEWAILLSANQMGGNRFPSAQWMAKLADHAENLDLAGHLCGRWLRNLMNDGDSSFMDELDLWPHFKRIQLNFHGEKFDINNESLPVLRKETWVNKKEFIVQMDGVNNDLYKQMTFAGVLASGLFDQSHGAGVLPDNGFPGIIPSINPRAWRGYAGGLGVENLEEQLEILATKVENDIVWIDTETKMRSNNDAQFDLDKVRKFLEIAKRWT